MNLMFFFLCLLKLIFFFTLLYVTSLALFSSNSIASSSSKFISIVITIILVTSLFAVLTSAGNSILIINLFLLAFLFAKRKVNIELKLANALQSKEYFSFGIITLILCFGFHFIQVFDVLENSIRVIHSDYYYYGRAASFLRDTGIENGNVEHFLTDKDSPTPYHYFELWLAAFFSKIFNVHGFYSLKLFAFPIIQTLAIFGAYEFIKSLRLLNRKKSKLLIAIVAFCTIFYSGFNILNPSFIDLFKGDLYGIGIFQFSKASIILVLLLLYLIFEHENQTSSAFICLGLLAINYTPVLPSILVFIVLRNISLVILKKETFQVLLKQSLPFILIIFGLCIFYLINTEKAVHGVSENTILEVWKGKFWVTSRNIFIKTVLQLIFIFSPFILILILCRKTFLKSKYLRPFVYLGLLNLSGIISWTLFPFMFNAVQLWSNIHIASSALMVFLSIVVLLSHYSDRSSKFQHVIVFIIPIVFISYSFYSFPFSTEKITLKKEDLERFSSDSKFAYIRNPESYKGYYDQLEQIYFGNQCKLNLLMDPYKTVCLSTEFIPKYTDIENEIQAQFTFNKYCDDLCLNDSICDIALARKRFIEEFEIDYLLVEEGASIPPELTALFSFESSYHADGYDLMNRLK